MNPNTPTPIYGHSIPPVVLATDYVKLERELAEAKALNFTIGNFLLHLRDSVQVSPNIGAHAHQLWREMNLPEDPPKPTICEALDTIDQLSSRVAELTADKDRLMAELIEVQKYLRNDAISAGVNGMQSLHVGVIQARLRDVNAALDSARAKT